MSGCFHLAGTPPTSAPSSGGISGGAIAGIIVGGLLLLAFVIVIVIVVWKKSELKVLVRVEDEENTRCNFWIMGVDTVVIFLLGAY